MADVSRIALAAEGIPEPQSAEPEPDPAEIIRSYLARLDARNDAFLAAGLPLEQVIEIHLNVIGRLIARYPDPHYRNMVISAVRKALPDTVAMQRQAMFTTAGGILRPN